MLNGIIKGTRIQDGLIKWKKGALQTIVEVLGLVTGGNFKRETKLESRRGQKSELDGQNWTIYTNFVHMYLHNISIMIESRVAIKLDAPVHNKII